ncbi:MAG: UDP-N-acetylmuramate:L-alanyl-gamma-D-glutamyl-meso-diaminopimelate ligase [Candidatus Latescibacteria bacterium]|nr:UDP-N-acetylmuramate:L-alanyl-gamma-D-glutamyl-meso-diaminopimelate ligase [Candidatus Latescibacterota bacterium]
MGALAVMLKSQGHHVTGSDRDVYPPMSTVLERQGIPVSQGFDPAHLEPAPDLVVIGNAVSRGNPEAEAVLDRKTRYLSMPEALKEFFLWGKRSLVVTGTHGKTTTTALLAWTIDRAGLDPSAIIGGVPVDWETGAKLGQGEYFVLEGDEYDSAFFDKRAKFLHYLPEIVVINNIEFDHADIYGSLDEIVLAFKRLINLIPRNGLLVANGDDPAVRSLLSGAFCPVHTFGFGLDARWAARDIRVSPAGTGFEVLDDGRSRGQVSVPLYGEHNVQNTLAVIAVADAIGLSWKTTSDNLRSFPGVKRRLEVRGVVNGVTVYDDFAHHPTAVDVTLRALRAAYPAARIWAVFEPRTATTIRRVFQDAYGRAFDAADRVVLAPVFNPHKAPEDNRLSIERLIADLRQRGKDAIQLPDIPAIVEHLAERTQPGDHVVFMSNGGFGGIHERFLGALRGNDT